MRSKYLFSIFATAVALLGATTAEAAVTAGNTGWLWGNPLPQGESLQTIDVIGNRAYAGGDAGTLLRSDDAGATWGTVRTGLLDTVKLVRSIGPDSFVFATACALRRSDDGGQTVRRLPWTPSDVGCSPEIKSFHFPSANVGYLLLDSGDVYATVDGGSTWTRKTALTGSASAGGGNPVGDIWFTGDNTGVATVDSQVYRTTDGASSWSPVGAPAPAGLDRFAFVNANVGMVVGKNKLVFTTGDGGVSWAPSTIVPGTAGIALDEVDCANPNICLAVAADGSQLYVTSDGGANWSAVSPSTKAVHAAGFASATRILGVGAGGVTVASDDGGGTWQTVSNEIEAQYWGLHVVSEATAYAYGANGALARTVNGGASWSMIGVATAARLTGVGFPSPTRGYVLDENGALSRTDNGGVSWQFLDTGGVKAANIVVPAADTIVLIGPKGIFRSTDGGNNFARSKGRNLRRARISKSDRGGSRLFAYGKRGIWMSTKSGRYWKPVKKPRRARSIVKLDMVTSKAGYLLDSRGELWRTKNAGRKWTRVETTGAVNGDAIAFGSLKSGYIADASGRILRTTDGGRTWSRQYPLYDPYQNASMVIEAGATNGAFLLLGGTSKLFSTSTGGKMGVASRLKIKASKRKVKRNTSIRVTGKLSPALGGELVSVVARPLKAKDGARWVAQEATVASNGSFTTRWKIKKSTIFIARWSGDSGHDGDAARAVIVKLKPKRKRKR